MITRGRVKMQERLLKSNVILSAHFLRKTHSMMIGN